ncbi:MAG TPA: response regulator [Granulicella sp.]
MYPYLPLPTEQEHHSRQAFPKTILLVDDDPDIRSLTRTFLEHEGYRVHSCGSTERALQIFHNACEHSNGIDLLITDFYMPDMSGVELAQELKTVQPKLPVLVISGFLSGYPLEEFPKDHWKFLSKPFALPELLTTVHAMLGCSEVSGSAEISG